VPNPRGGFEPNSSSKNWLRDTPDLLCIAKDNDLTCVFHSGEARPSYLFNKDLAPNHTLHIAHFAAHHAAVQSRSRVKQVAKPSLWRHGKRMLHAKSMPQHGYCYVKAATQNAFMSAASFSPGALSTPEATST